MSGWSPATVFSQSALTYHSASSPAPRKPRGNSCASLLPSGKGVCSRFRGIWIKVVSPVVVSMEATMMVSVRGV